MFVENVDAPCVSLPAYVLNPLRERGFEPEGWSYRTKGLAFTARGRWYVLSDTANGPDDPSLPEELSQPGLWKWVHKGASAQRLFEFPCWAVSVQTESEPLDESGPAPFERLLNWALETRWGRVSPDWHSPEEALVRSWLAPGALTIQARGYVRQTELILQPGCWAIRVPILPPLAEQLPEPRRRALAALAAEAQRRWAMVRLSRPADFSLTGLVAEVDFSGAPHCELLFSAGLEVLRHVVAWLVETAEVLGDPEVLIECLAPGEHNNSNQERSTP